MGLAVSPLVGAEASELFGKWSFAYDEGGEAMITSIGVTVFRADGTYYSAVVFSADHPDANHSIASAFSGDWKLEESTLTMTLQKTNTPQFAPVGTVVTCEILEITDEYYRYRSSDGKIRKERRIKI